MASVALDIIKGICVVIPSITKKWHFRIEPCTTSEVSAANTLHITPDHLIEIDSAKAFSHSRPPLAISHWTELHTYNESCILGGILLNKLLGSLVVQPHMMPNRLSHERLANNQLQVLCCLCTCLLRNKRMAPKKITETIHVMCQEWHWHWFISSLIRTLVGYQKHENANITQEHKKNWIIIVCSKWLLNIQPH